MKLEVVDGWIFDNLAIVVIELKLLGNHVIPLELLHYQV